MRRSTLVIISLFLCQQALAKEESIPKAVRAGVSAAVQNYAEAISCTEKGRPLVEDIKVLKPRKSELETAEYVAVWHGSTECEGVATGVSQFSIVSQRGNGEFKVSPERSTPAIEVGFPQLTFSRIVSISESSIVVEAAEFAESDPQCCPSLNFQYTLRIDKDENWRLISKKPVKSASKP